ncbi:hypothetical protein EU527_16375 [Candidatus Thorarchaeota archaeon]|nr:MAG: hypothetical protein EU527_16375 [Candidatus Thorarchaeota archaeon]
MTEEKKVYTIFDRPLGLRFIGLLQMSFGVAGFLATIGLIVAAAARSPELPGIIGYVYALLVFIGVAVPCLFIGNYVDDLRRNAVIAQIGYSLVAMALATLFLTVQGLHYMWTVPFFDTEIVLAVSNLAMFIVLSQSFVILYLVLSWDKAVPPEEVEVIRDRGEAKRIKREFVPTTLPPALVGSDGVTELSEEDSQEILDVRKIVTEEGMAILCSNCGGATPLTKIDEKNRLQCDYCGVTLGVSGVFVPCKNHSAFLAATTCSVCGEHFCRKCLTAQEPPIDTRWTGSTIFLCRKCFEGRYKPAVTTTSFVIPIGQLFSKAGSRFSTIGGIYRRFLGAYGGAMKYLWRLPLELLASFGKSGGGGGSGDNCAGAILVIIIIIIAIPILAGVILLLGAIIIIPILFYAGLIAVTIEAMKVISKTDFQSIDTIRIQSIIQQKMPKVKESTLRPMSRSWEDEYRVRSLSERQRMETERQIEEERRRRAGQQSTASFWGDRY